MTAYEKDKYYCSFVSIHYIICECGETFPSETELRAHLVKAHPHKRERKEYKCGVCDGIYPTEEECIQHYEESHLSMNIKEEGVEYGSEEDMSDSNLKIETNGDNEPVDEAADHVEVEMEADTEEVSEEYLTEVAKEASQHMQELQDNTQPPELMPSSEEGQFMKLYPDGSQLVLFVPGARPARAAGTSSTSGRARRIICEVCGKNYTSNAALKYHQRVHTGEKPYKCHLCPKSFTMPLFHQIHVRTHTGERPYQCQECPKAFSNKAALLRHDRVHTGEKPYHCPMCDKAFTQSNSMKLHVTTVHFKQPAPYKSKSRKIKAIERMSQPKQGKLVKIDQSKPMKIKLDAAKMASVNAIKINQSGKMKVLKLDRSNISPIKMATTKGLMKLNTTLSPIKVKPSAIGCTKVSPIKIVSNKITPINSVQKIAPIKLKSSNLIKSGQAIAPIKLNSSNLLPIKIDPTKLSSFNLNGLNLQSVLKQDNSEIEQLQMEEYTEELEQDYIDGQSEEYEDHYSDEQTEEFIEEKDQDVKVEQIEQVLDDEVVLYGDAEDRGECYEIIVTEKA